MQIPAYKSVLLCLCRVSLMVQGWEKAREYRVLMLNTQRETSWYDNLLNSL